MFSCNRFVNLLYYLSKVSKKQQNFYRKSIINFLRRIFKEIEETESK